MWPPILIMTLTGTAPKNNMSPLIEGDIMID